MASIIEGERELRLSDQQRVVIFVHQAVREENRTRIGK